MARAKFPDAPLFLIFAGPNGSGKTTAYTDADVENLGQSIWIINPDLLAARIRSIERLSAKRANLVAVERIEAWLSASIEAHQSVGVETVLSTDKYRLLVERAQRLGFEIALVYVILDSPRRNIERVRARVAKGGHNVPKSKIVARYARSLKQLPWFLEKADRAWIFDNSGASPKKIGVKDGKTVKLAPDAIPAVIDALAPGMRPGTPANRNKR